MTGPVKELLSNQHDLMNNMIISEAKDMNCSHLALST